MLSFLTKSKEVLGMNARNLHFLRPYNRKGAVQLADNKLRTKQVLSKENIPTPKLYGVIENEHDLANFDWEKLPESFVIKPNRGLGGGGIMIIFRRKNNGMWVTGSGREIPFFGMLSHLFTIFDGQFSLSGTPDTVFFEERIKNSKTLKPYCYQGVPDIRVIVFNRVPVMAMLRLPTKASEGRANLALGGVGVGIDIANGVTTHAMVKSTLFDKTVEHHPDNNLRLSGIRIPYWDEILEIAIRCQEVSGLGYIGVDIAIDREKGPVVLEINARAGLSIQTANLAPIGERLKRLKGLKVTSIKRGVRLAKELFGGEIQEEVEEITGRQVIGIKEDVTILGKSGQPKVIKAKIDTGAFSTSLDADVARELGYGELIEYFNTLTFQIEGMESEDDETIEEFFSKKYLSSHPDLEGVAFVRSSHGHSFRPKVGIQLTIAGKEMKIRANITDRTNLRYPMIIGRRNLSSFLIDPRRNT